MRSGKEKCILNRKKNLKTQAKFAFLVLLFVLIVLTAIAALIVTAINAYIVVFNFIPNAIFAFMVGCTAGITLCLLVFYFLLFVFMTVCEVLCL